MGKKNNVHPNHYKEAGRARPGQDTLHEQHKQKLKQAQTRANQQPLVQPGGTEEKASSLEREAA